MMRKDVSEGQSSKKIRKNDEKRRFRRSKVKVKKIRFLLNALKNEENKGNNAMFLVECDKK